jgi:hypothetical protein
MNLALHDSRSEVKVLTSPFLRYAFSVPYSGYLRTRRSFFLSFEVNLSTRVVSSFTVRRMSGRTLVERKRSLAMVVCLCISFWSAAGRGEVSSSAKRSLPAGVEETFSQVRKAIEMSVALTFFRSCLSSEEVMSLLVG